MGRPLTGKLHTGQRRETRANGDVYVYERVTAYDPKTQKTKTVSTRLLGKIPAGQTEMIPTRPKKTKTSAKPELADLFYAYGVLDSGRFIGKSSYLVGLGSNQASFYLRA